MTDQGKINALLAAMLNENKVNQAYARAAIRELLEAQAKCDNGLLLDVMADFVIRQ